MSLEARTIILGISGGIAAYKSPDLVSQLKKLGANIYICATENALKFVTPLSLEVMSGHPVYTKQNSNSKDQIEHIALADKADLVLIAPATADCIAKLVTGISDDMLYDLVLASRAPIVVAPAMNTNMWEHATVKRNIQVLRSMNYQIIEPEEGELACGHFGAGRLAENSSIIKVIEEVLASAPKKPQAVQPAEQQERHYGIKPLVKNKVFTNPLEKQDGKFVFNPTKPEEVIEENYQISEQLKLIAGKKIIITVGATREKIDPVRFITNRSSGKMGFALAREALAAGAKVKLISTIDCTEAWIKNVELSKVETHQEMYEAVFNSFTKSSPYAAPADALIMVAAVSDYRPRESSEQKIKKPDDTQEAANSGGMINAIVNMINEANSKIGDITLQLEKTPDILQELSKVKQANQVVIGFSVETENLIDNSRKKIYSKGLDFIVANSPAAFGADEAEVSIIASDLRADRIPVITSMPKESKRKIARKVLEYLGLCLEGSKATAR